MSEILNTIETSMYWIAEPFKEDDTPLNSIFANIIDNPVSVEPDTLNNQEEQK